MDTQCWEPDFYTWLQWKCMLVGMACSDLADPVHKLCLLEDAHWIIWTPIASYERPLDHMNTHWIIWTPTGSYIYTTPFWITAADMNAIQKNTGYQQMCQWNDHLYRESKIIPVAKVIKMNQFRKHGHATRRGDGYVTKGGTKHEDDWTNWEDDLSYVGSTDTTTWMKRTSAAKILEQ